MNFLMISCDFWFPCQWGTVHKLRCESTASSICPSFFKRRPIRSSLTNHRATAAFRVVPGKGKRSQRDVFVKGTGKIRKSTNWKSPKENVVGLWSDFLVLRKWGASEYVGFLSCPVGFVLVQYVIFIASLRVQSSNPSSRDDFWFKDVSKHWAKEQSPGKSGIRIVERLLGCWDQRHVFVCPVSI